MALLINPTNENNKESLTIQCPNCSRVGAVSPPPKHLESGVKFQCKSCLEYITLQLTCDKPNVKDIHSNAFRLSFELGFNWAMQSKSKSTLPSGNGLANLFIRTDWLKDTERSIRAACSAGYWVGARNKEGKYDDS